MSPKIKIDTLIVSDIHLGAKASQAKNLVNFLKTHTFKRLIILGDFLDNSYFSKVRSDDSGIISLIRELASSKDRYEVIWVRGNHDKEVDGIISHALGLKQSDQYAWEHNGKRYLAVHGDQFDHLMERTNKAHAWIHYLYLFVQNFDRSGRHLVKIIDLSNATLRKLSGKVSDGAIRYAKEQKAEYIFCGHTHIAMKKTHTDEYSTVKYYNVGCWTHTPSTFAAIDDNNNVFLEKF